MPNHVAELARRRERARLGGGGTASTPSTGAAS